MIHKYKLGGKNIVLDVNSGAIHIVDDITYEVAGVMEEFSGAASEDMIIQRMSGYPTEELRECISEIENLKDKKLLFCEDIFKSGVPKRKSVFKALCLHIAHDCNLKCAYCFAGEGEYRGKRSLMPSSTGKKALDFLVENSGGRKNLEIDFFGGEPTINFDAVSEIVSYGRKLESMHNKNFRFTLTTNALSITGDMIDFTNKHMSNVVLSIDGRKEIHDKMRPMKNGGGSYDKVLKNIERFVKSRDGKDYYVRGTFTANNLDFSKDVIHLHELGFNQISIEPAVTPPDKEYAITKSDLPRLFNEYEVLTQYILKNPDLCFFHFNIDLTGGSCALKRLSGCGAGCEYAAVTPDGSLYPCHQFAGADEFLIGTVYNSVQNESLIRQFSELNVYSKKACAECWARFYCSGGCAANAYYYGGLISSVYEIGCLLQKKRIECAIYLALARNGEFNS